MEYKEMQLMPDLTPDEYLYLRETISKFGVRVPIVICGDTGEIIDGHNRLKICNELGIKNYPVEKVYGLSELEKRQMARMLNLARRHMTQAQRRILIQDQLRESYTMSDRQIAAGLGVSDKTVGTQRKEMVGRAEIPHVDKVTDSLGREQPRKPVGVFNPDERTERYLQNPAVVERVAETGVSVRRAHTMLRREEKAKRKDTTGIELLPKDCELFVADIRDGLPELESNSVNLVCIAPPYSYNEFGDLWEPMAREAERILVDHGILLCMAGTANLDRKMAALSKYLRYHWTLTVLAERASPGLQWMGISPRYKPVLVYVKKSWQYTGEVATDVLRTPPDEGDKDEHRL